jgi:uncharacterized iron-regulated protein
MMRPLLAALALPVLLLTACASTQTVESEPVVLPPEAAPGYDDGYDATTLTILKGDASGKVSFDDMIADLADADIILVGEMHNHTESLDFIATTFETLVEQNSKLDLSMEFYERDEQIALDDYLAGITDYAAFVKAAGRTESNNPIAHLRMIELARLNNRAVIAANAPRRYTRLARTGGFQALADLNHRQRALVEIPNSLPTGSYADRFRDAMGAMAAHGGDEMINSFLRSQTVWDQTMAASIADQHTQQATSIFHVVGHFHVDHATTPGGSALADAIHHRLGDDIKLRSLVMHMTEGDLDTLTEEDAGDETTGPAADYIVYFPMPAE